MTTLISSAGIIEAIDALDARPDTLKGRLLAELRTRLGSDEAGAAITAIPADELIAAVWQLDDGQEIRQKRKNFSSLKSAINKELKALDAAGRNPESLILGKENVFEVSSSKKDELLFQMGVTARTDPELAKEFASFRREFGQIAEQRGWHQLEDLLAEVDRQQQRADSLAGQLRELSGQINELTGELAMARQGFGNGAGGTQTGFETGDAAGAGAGTGEGKGEGEGLQGGGEKSEPGQEGELEIIEIGEEDLIEEVDQEQAEAITEETPEEELEEIESLEELVEAEAEEITEAAAEEIVEELTEIVEELPAASELEAEPAPEELAEEELLEEEIEEITEIEEIKESEPQVADELAAGTEAQVIDELTEIVEEDLVEEIEEVAEVETIELEQPETITEEASEEELVEVEEEEIAEAAAEKIIEEEVEEIDADDLIEITEDDQLEAGSNQEQAGGGLPSSGLLDALSEYMEADTALGGDEETLNESHEDYVAHILERFTPKFIHIPAGVYRIGASQPQAMEQRERTVQLASFYLGQTPVTNDLFDLFVRETGYQTDAERAGHGIVYTGRCQNRIDPQSGRTILSLARAAASRTVEGADWRHPHGPGSSTEGLHNHPVVQISRLDAIAFAAWAGKRLPTEEEWEAAARGGDGRLFPWGDMWLPRLANLETSMTGSTTPVGHYGLESASPFGILDLIGNVWEWTASRYQMAAGSGRKIYILKGGSWVSGSVVAAHQRMIEQEKHWSNIIGFRCSV